MKSTNYNIDNPLQVNSIDLGPDFRNLPLVSSVVTLTKQEYDIMPQHDPYTYYFISGLNYCYIGDLMIHYSRKSEYLLALDYSGDNESFIVCMVDHGHIVPISKFKKATDAINLLRYYTKYKSADTFRVNITKLIESYFDDNINILQLLPAIISEFGYQNDMDLQEIIGLQNYALDKGSAVDDVPLFVIDKKGLNKSLTGRSIIYHLYYHLYLVFSNYPENRKASWNKCNFDILIESIMSIYRRIPTYRIGDSI